MKLEIPDKFSKKYSNIKFHENAPSGSRVVPCGLRTDGQTDMAKIIVVFRNCSKAQNKKGAQNVKEKDDFGQ